MTDPTAKFAEQAVDREDAGGGVLYMRARHGLGPVAASTGVWLDDWTARAPGRVFIAERSGEGWREVTFAEARQQVRAVAAGLLARGLGPDRPIALLSGNGVDHALLTLAAQYVGIPTAPIAEQYSLIHGAHSRLRHVLGRVEPAMAFVDDAGKYAEALNLDVLADAEIVAVKTAGAPRPAHAFADLLDAGDDAAVDAAHAKVGPDTVAKYLFTSGSTSGPKGVVTTHGMLCVNQAQLRAGWPLLGARPPRIVDWLPWNHVFGGSHNFNMMLANGGSLYIDHGRPTPAAFATSVKNIRDVGCTLSFNVPIGYAMLAKEMETDRDLRRAFFADQDILFYAGASLQADVWDALKRQSMDECGREPTLASSWGMTETAPATLLIHEEIDQPGRIGVPVAGVTAKLLNDGEDRFELRVGGPNIMTTYLNDPEKTAESFDDEGYLITGDAVRFVDVDDPARGFRFDGRISEDFKLTTGTWVHASKLRLAAVEAMEGLAADLVVTGQDRNEIGVLIFPNRGGLEKREIGFDQDGGALLGDALRAAFHERLTFMAKDATGSSTRICRALVLAEPPSMGDGEITDKGNINQRKVQERRAELVARLYDDADPAVVTL